MHDIKVTVLECIIQWHLVHSRCCIINHHFCQVAKHPKIHLWTHQTVTPRSRRPPVCRPTAWSCCCGHCTSWNPGVWPPIAGSSSVSGFPGCSIVSAPFLLVAEWSPVVWGSTLCGPLPERLIVCGAGSAVVSQWGWDGAGRSLDPLGLVQRRDSWW